MIAYGTDTFEVHDFVRAGIPLTIIAFALIMILGANLLEMAGTGLRYSCFADYKDKKHM